MPRASAILESQLLVLRVLLLTVTAAMSFAVFIVPAPGTELIVARFVCYCQTPFFPQARAATQLGFGWL